MNVNVRRHHGEGGIDLRAGYPISSSFGIEVRFFGLSTSLMDEILYTYFTSVVLMVITNHVEDYA